MREYRIRITGEYDVIVLSPGIIGILIERIRHSDEKELVIPAEEILPRGYAAYLSCVLNANAGVIKVEEPGAEKPETEEPEVSEAEELEVEKPETEKPEVSESETSDGLPDRNVYTLVAEQIRKLQYNEQDCFDRVEVTGHESNPRFDMDASEDFYIVTKQENSHFLYVFKDDNNEEIGIVLEYL